MISRHLPRLAGFVCAAALLGSACGGGGSNDTTADAEPAAIPEATAAPSAAPSDGSAGSEAPSAPGGVVPDIMAFSSPLVGGGEIDVATLVDKPTAFWFWSPT